MSKPADLVQGTLDLPLRKIVALEPLHAWAIRFRDNLDREAANRVRPAGAISRVVGLSSQVVRLREA
jgi:hypothetical protein